VTEISQVVAQAERLDLGDKLKVGALLLIRYCSFYRDRKFSRWFEREQQVLGRVVESAVQVVRAVDGQVNFTELQQQLDEVLEESDPGGPPFQVEIVDHMVFATEVLEYLQEPTDASKLAAALERADELAEAHLEMSQEEEFPSALGLVDFPALEGEARGLDVLATEDSGAALARSQRFAQAYTDMVEAYYADEDAGIFE
jgi:hypothetical protein